MTKKMETKEGVKREGGEGKERVRVRGWKSSDQFSKALAYNVAIHPLPSLDSFHPTCLCLIFLFFLFLSFFLFIYLSNMYIFRLSYIILGVTSMVLMGR